MADPKTPEEWKKHLSEFDAWNERVFFAMLAAMGKPNSILDIGCGTAAMVKAARLLKIDAIGIDLIKNKPPDLVRDLTKPINLGRTFGFVMSIEVAEHIPVNKVGVFLTNITSHVNKGGILLFSAAHPGQGGDNHENLRSAMYWRNRLYDRGMAYRDDLSYKIRMAWLNIPMPMYWLVSNVQIYEH